MTGALAVVQLPAPLAAGLADGPTVRVLVLEAEDTHATVDGYHPGGAPLRERWALALVAVLTVDGPRLLWVARERLDVQTYQPDDDGPQAASSREHGAWVSG